MEDFGQAIEAVPEAVVVLTQPSWCVPCRRLKPHLDKLAERGTEVIVIDLDTVPQAIQDFGVQGIPQILFYRNGQYLKDLEGRTVIQLTREVNDA